MAGITFLLLALVGLAGDGSLRCNQVPLFSSRRVIDLRRPRQDKRTSALRKAIADGGAASDYLAVVRSFGLRRPCCTVISGRSCGPPA
jgi:hypothetical protein